LYQRPLEEWWMHHFDNCDNYPPPDGEFLELPAGKSFTVELAANRAMTTLSYEGKYTSEWPDGRDHPEDYHTDDGCITEPNLHTQNQSMAAGTAFAISYESDIKAVKPDNLVVFSVLHHTPWKRVATYQVPAALPACPPGGCHCAWGWVANGCGQPNMYMQPHRCLVTGATSTTRVAPAKPPVWCEDDPSACVKGAKQMIYWNQASGNNIEVTGWDLSGNHKSPTYNMKLGFKNGPQDDIFEGSTSQSKSGVSSTSSSSGTDGKKPVVSASNPTDTKSPSSGTGGKESVSSKSGSKSSASGTGGKSKKPEVSASKPSTKSASSHPKKTSGRCKKRRSNGEGPNLVKKSSIVPVDLTSHLKRRHAHQAF